MARRKVTRPQREKHSRSKNQHSNVTAAFNGLAGLRDECRPLINTKAYVIGLKLQTDTYSKNHIT
jgi:hypothetical protein